MPLRLEFSTAWDFYDSLASAPVFWSAMNSVGVYDKSPMTVSMVINDRDTNPDITQGVYAIQGGYVEVGPVRLTLLPASLRVYPWGIYTGAASLVGSPAGGCQPFYWEFQHDYQSAPLTDDLLTAISDLQSFSNRNYLFVAYRGGSINCGYCMSFSQSMVLTKVEPVPVPESSQVLLMLSGLFVFLARRRQMVMLRTRALLCRQR